MFKVKLFLALGIISALVAICVDVIYYNGTKDILAIYICLILVVLQIRMLIDVYKRNKNTRLKGEHDG